jgi:Zn-dependent M28 family amino/carboxypeptidase
VFIGFTAEEEGEIGSKFYVKQLSKEQKTAIRAMVNMDTLGVSSTKVWQSHADKELSNLLGQLAGAMKLPLAGVNVEAVGSTDSEQFRDAGIPAMTIHSITQETWPILHSPRDQLAAIKLDDYYQTYRLIAAYLSFIDTKL